MGINQHCHKERIFRASCSVLLFLRGKQEDESGRQAVLLFVRDLAGVDEVAGPRGDAVPHATHHRLQGRVLVWPLPGKRVPVGLVRGLQDLEREDCKG